MIAYEWVVWLILLFPLAAFVILGIVGRRLPEGGGHVAVGAMAGSFSISLYVFIQVLQRGGLGGSFSQPPIEGYVWLPSRPGNEIRIALLIDNLSALMLVLVSFLCLLIFVYSLGYMHEEEGKARYYAEVSLFATGMLGTVSADNFLQLLIFWEIMGLCMYPIWERDSHRALDRQPQRAHARPRVVPLPSDLRLFPRIHARGGGQGPLLRGSQPLRHRDARHRERGQLPPAPDFLGDHGPLHVSDLGTRFASRS